MPEKCSHFLWLLLGACRQKRWWEVSVDKKRGWRERERGWERGWEKRVGRDRVEKERVGREREGGVRERLMNSYDTLCLLTWNLTMSPSTFRPMLLLNTIFCSASPRCSGLGETHNACSRAVRPSSQFPYQQQRLSTGMIQQPLDND